MKDTLGCAGAREIAGPCEVAVRRACPRGCRATHCRDTCPPPRASVTASKTAKADNGRVRAGMRVEAIADTPRLTAIGLSLEVTLTTPQMFVLKVQFRHTMVDAVPLCAPPLPWPQHLAPTPSIPLIPDDLHRLPRCCQVLRQVLPYFPALVKRVAGCRAECQVSRLNPCMADWQLVHGP